MMVKFRNSPGQAFRNVAGATAQPIEKVARVTGLEPATSGVTGRAFPEQKQAAFRKRHSRNDAFASEATNPAFGTPAPLTAPEILGWSLLIVAAVLWAASGVWAGTQAVARLLETLP